MYHVKPNGANCSAYHFHKKNKQDKHDSTSVFTFANMLSLRQRNRCSFLVLGICSYSDILGSTTVMISSTYYKGDYPRKQKYE